MSPAPDDGDLTRSLAALHGLVSRPQALQDNLSRIVGLAAAAIPGADGAALTLLPARGRGAVATADFVAAVDALQDDLTEGPRVSAVSELRTVLTGNLGGDRRWPRFGPRAGRLGVHSALSLPLRANDAVLAALHLYSHERDAFASRAAGLAERFASQAAVNVSNAVILADAEQLIDQLQQALVSRAEIDQAIGVLMSRTGVSAAQAFERLRAMSTSRSIKLSVVAREILGEAVRRAHARRSPTAEQ